MPSPVDFLERVVRPNVDEFLKNYSDERRAFNAIASVDALAAHFYVWARHSGHPCIAGAAHDSDFRGRLARRDPSFSLLRDVAKAQKHVELTQGKPAVSAADQVKSQPQKWGEMKWGEFRWGASQVVIAITAGEYEYVETIIREALEFLIGEMRAAGLAISAPTT